jgi:IS5 family transposase
MDATLIAAPSPTKSEEKKRDPDMHQAKKGNPCDFGKKVHIGVDKDGKLVHSLTTPAANDHDSPMVGDLLLQNEKRESGAIRPTSARRRRSGKRHPMASTRPTKEGHGTGN